MSIIFFLFIGGSISVTSNHSGSTFVDILPTAKVVSSNSLSSARDGTAHSDIALRPEEQANTGRHIRTGGHGLRTCGLFPGKGRHERGARRHPGRGRRGRQRGHGNRPDTGHRGRHTRIGGRADGDERQVNLYQTLLFF